MFSRLRSRYVMPVYFSLYLLPLFITFLHWINSIIHTFLCHVSSVLFSISITQVSIDILYAPRNDLLFCVFIFLSPLLFRFTWMGKSNIALRFIFFSHYHYYYLRASLTVAYIYCLILFFFTLFFTFFTCRLLPHHIGKYNTAYYAQIFTLVQLVFSFLLFFCQSTYVPPL